jgi:hypothetical protein
MPLKSPYVQGERKGLLNSLVVFADVLGFSNEMKAAYEKGTPQSLLDRFSEAIESSYLGLQDTFESPDYPRPTKSWDFKAFTDNIVIGFPIAIDGEHEMLSILERLAVFQLTMIQKSFFIRGGVAVGEHYMDSNIVFGGALIEAYEAESELAREPRIVLAASAVSNFRRHLSYYSKATYSWHYNVVLKDSDGHLFLNYLDMTRPYDQSDVDVFHESIHQHKEIVLQKLEEFSGNPYIRSKYVWVANYHNYFCDQYSLEPELKINYELLQITPQRIDEEFEIAKAAIRS